MTLHTSPTTYTLSGPARHHARRRVCPLATLSARPLSPFLLLSFICTRRTSRLLYVSSSGAELTVVFHQCADDGVGGCIDNVRPRNMHGIPPLALSYLASPSRSAPAADDASSSDGSSRMIKHRRSDGRAINGGDLAQQQQRLVRSDIHASEDDDDGNGQVEARHQRRQRRQDDDGNGEVEARHQRRQRRQLVTDDSASGGGGGVTLGAVSLASGAQLVSSDEIITLPSSLETPAASALNEASALPTELLTQPVASASSSAVLSSKKQQQQASLATSATTTPSAADSAQASLTTTGIPAAVSAETTQPQQQQESSEAGGLLTRPEDSLVPTDVSVSGYDGSSSSAVDQQSNAPVSASGASSAAAALDAHSRSTATVLSTAQAQTVTSPLVVVTQTRSSASPSSASDSSQAQRLNDSTSGAVSALCSSGRAWHSALVAVVVPALLLLV